MLSLDSNIHEMPVVAVDLETSGAYPIGNEICEIGMVRYQNGKVVDEYQSLVKPTKKMGRAVIKIHGITNEMVEYSPSIEDVLPIVHNMLKDAVVIAHHAPFDLGFLAYDFERYSYDLPQMPALCSSLLSRKLFPEAPNHRLQTLIRFFELEQGVAHRALDDAVACLEVAKHCFDKSEPATLKNLIAIQAKKLSWDSYSIDALRRNAVLGTLVDAIEKKQEVKIDYEKAKGVSRGRGLKPWGIVRNPDGDYVNALCLRDNKNKRFYLNKIRETYSSSSFESEDS